MTGTVDIHLPFGLDAPPRRLAVYLGSFDPPHRGHRFLVDTVLRRCDALLLLLPAWHVSKRIAPPHNASLAQRVAMLAPWHARAGGRMAVGVTDEVLFVRLERLLRWQFADSELWLVMGNDTLARLQASPRYFARHGLAWSDDEERALQKLLRRTLVFARSAEQPGWIAVPATLREVSSTRVRQAVAERRGAGEGAEPDELERWIEPATRRFIEAEGLYPADVSGRFAA